MIVDGKRCENESQHLRKIGDIRTPRIKRWATFCPKHYDTALPKELRDKIIKSLG